MSFSLDLAVYCKLKTSINVSPLSCTNHIWVDIGCYFIHIHINIHIWCYLTVLGNAFSIRHQGHFNESQTIIFSLPSSAPIIRVSFPKATKKIWWMKLMNHVNTIHTNDFTVFEVECRTPSKEHYGSEVYLTAQNQA